MINAAIVGLGRWGQMLVNSVQGKSDKIRFVGGQTRTSSADAQAFAEGHGFSLIETYEDIMGRDDIDAVVLASPHSLHAEQVQRAAEAGKHVLCEKPFTLDRASAESSVNACQDAGVVLGVAHNRRFLPAYKDLQEMLRSGTLGEILHLEGNFSNPAGYLSEGGNWRTEPGESTLGSMAAKGVHTIDAMVGLVGPIKCVTGQSSRKVLTAGDDTTSVMLGFGDSISGYVGTMDATGYLWRLAVFGSKGWAEMRSQHCLATRMIEDGENTETVKDYEAVDTLRLELEAFAGAINGGAPYPMTDEEMIATPALWEAAIKAVSQGRTITL
jgi:predicted dehydrogenase